MATSFLYDAARSIMILLNLTEPPYQYHISIHDFTNPDPEGFVPNSACIAVYDSRREANAALAIALGDMDLTNRRICRRFVTTTDPIGICHCTTNGGGIKVVGIVHRVEA